MDERTPLVGDSFGLELELGTPLGRDSLGGLEMEGGQAVVENRVESLLMTKHVHSAHWLGQFILN